MNPKPGIKTTEFWITAITTLILLLLSYQMITEDVANAWISVLPVVIPVVVYTVSRHKSKN